LGIPNIRGTVVEYSGDTPEPPLPTKKRNSIKWLQRKCKKININY
jgi:hypothetical protein